MATLKQIATARRNGIRKPYMVSQVCTQTGLPFHIACAFLEQESYGGQNIYGHDVDANGYPRPFWGHGQVTKTNYAAYLKERDLGISQAKRFPKLGRRSQGVGPMQLTFYSFQDEADAEGGCWNYKTNLTVAFRYIMSLRKKGYSWYNVARIYNGKESYAAAMRTKFTKWKNLLA